MIGPFTIKRRFIACLNHHYTLGETFLAEGIITWLEFAQIPYLALDLNKDYPKLYSRHPETTHVVDAQGDTRENLVEMLHLVEESPEFPVILADFPYHKNSLTKLLFDDLPTLQVFQHFGIRMTLPVLFGAECRTLDSIGDVVSRFKDTVDYLMVDNPSRYTYFNYKFKEDGVYKRLQESNCPTFTIPRCSKRSIEDWEIKLENRFNPNEGPLNPLSLGQVYNHPELSFTTRAELSALRQGFIEECEKHAHVLLPHGSLMKRRYLDSIE
jgi:hypothetical protein